MARTTQAKRYAIDVVKRGQEVLVVFPEGEIYYLNDLVQPFKSGVVEIGMQAVVEAQARPAGLDRIPGPHGHQVPLPPAHRSGPGAADPLDGAASLPAHSR